MSNSQLYSESTGSIPVVPAGQGIYEISSTAKARLGDKREFQDGRVFRYAKAGATDLAAGKLVKAGGGACFINIAVAATTTTGAYSVEVNTVSAATTGAEGYLLVNDVTGEGTYYKIKDTAESATTSGDTTVTLYDPLSVSLTTSSEVTALSNPYEQCEIIAASTDIPLGVPPILVTKEYYFWLQTHGVANVLSEGTAAAGQVVFGAVSTSAGGVTGFAATTGMTGASVFQTPVGTMLLIGVDTEYKPVRLNIVT